MKKHGLFLIILLTALIVRFHNFPVWFGFDYDQEVNAWLAKTIVVDHKLILIGPETSIGGMFVGPYFNFVIAAFYALGKMNPMATLVLNIFLSAATISLIYLVGKKVFSKTTGLLAAIIYAFSYNLTNFDRVSWNPTPIPLVSLATTFFLWRYLHQKKPWQLAVTIALAGLMFHLHFTAVFVLAFIAVSLVFFGGKRFWLRKEPYLICATVMSVFFLPLFVFDLRHDFLITRHFFEFFAGGQTIQLPAHNLLWIFVTFVRAIFYNDSQPFLDLLALIFLSWSGVVGWRAKTEKRKFFLLALILCAVPVVALSFYHGALPAHYLLFTLPVVVVILAESLVHLGHLVAPLFLIIFLWVNVPAVLRTQNGLALKYKHDATHFVVVDADKKSFKVDFISQPGRKTGFKYLFWLEKKELIEDMAQKTEKTYKIIVPYFLVPESDLTAKFGGVGVVRVE